MSNKTFRFLILTEHKRHSPENSLYALVTTLYQHPRCREIVIVSRSQNINQAFFDNPATEIPFGQSIAGSFNYKDRDTFFEVARPLPDWNKEFDVIWLRLPRPVSDSFFTQLFPAASKKLFINHPLGIVKTSTKEFLLKFPELCPPLKLCKELKDIESFARAYPIVLKPLRDYGGNGIARVVDNRVELDGKWMTLPAYVQLLGDTLSEEGILAMKFLKGVSEGDKRLLVVNGKVMAASLRRPPKDAWICNVAQGGSSELAFVAPEEQRIVDQLAPVLKKEGIFICGLDTLVDDNGKRTLSEINTLSIGGFPQAEAQTGKPILQHTIDELIKYADEFYYRN